MIDLGRLIMNDVVPGSGSKRVATLTLSKLIQMIQGENMPKKLIAPVKEEVKPVAAKKTVKTTRPSEKVEAKTSTKKAASTVATPQSARHYATQILLAGAPREEIKKRAMALAKKEGAVVSFKTFDVSFFIKHLESKGYKTRESNGSIRLIAPKGA
jgi:hypothetical protein